MFLMSTLYHAMQFETEHKKVFRILDHSAIYVAIASTFTPIILRTLDGFFLWTMLILQWGLVFLGVIYKSLVTHKQTKSGLILYLVMGWSALLLMPKLFATQSFWFFIFILLGGIFYSVGIIFYSQKSIACFHFIGHIFVNMAALSHFVAVVFFDAMIFVQSL